MQAPTMTRLAGYVLTCLAMLSSTAATAQAFREDVTFRFRADQIRSPIKGR